MWQKLEKRIWNNKISKAYVLSLITYREKLTEREICSLKNAEMSIKTREILCSWSHGVSTGNNEFKLKQKRFWLYTMNNFPTAVIKKWQNTLPREAAESTFSEIFFVKKRASICCFFVSLQGEFIQPSSKEMNQEPLQLLLSSQALQGQEQTQALVPSHCPSCQWCPQQLSHVLGTVLGTRAPKFVPSSPCGQGHQIQGKKQSTTPLYWPSGPKHRPWPCCLHRHSLKVPTGPNFCGYFCTKLLLTRRIQKLSQNTCNLNE